MTELFLNGQKADIGKSIIAQSFQINTFAKLEQKKANVTNHFKLPFTTQNKQIFDGMATAGTTSNLHRQFIPAQIYIDGIQTADGVATLTEFDGKNYELIVLSGNKALNTIFKDDLLSDLDLSEYDHVPTQSIINNSLNNTEGYIYAKGDYFTKNSYNEKIKIGLYNIGAQAQGKPKVIFNPKEWKYRPKSIFAHTLIKKIFESKGVKYKGFFENNEEFKKLVVPCVKKETQNFQKKLTQKNTFTQKGVSSPKTYYFNTNDNVNLLEFKGKDGVFQLDINIDLESTKFKNSYKIEEFIAHVQVGANNINLEIENLPNNNKKLKALLKIAQNETINLHLQIKQSALMNGAKYYPHGSSTARYRLEDIEISFLAKIEFSLKEKLNTSNSLPKLKQDDLIKEIMQRFCLQFRYNKSGEFEFIETKNIIKATPTDWSNKYIQHSEIYNVGDYAKENYIKYKQLTEGAERGKGTIKINDATLTDSKDLFTSKTYAPDKTNSFPFWDMSFSVEKAKINLKENCDKPCIFSLIQDDGQTLNFVSYQNYIKNYYYELSKVLEHKKLVKMWFNLDLNDIVSLDFFKPIYVKETGKIYLLQKVENYIQGRATRCEMLEIPA